MKTILIAILMLFTISANAQNWFPTTGEGTTYNGDPTIILQNSTHRFATDAEKASWGSGITFDDTVGIIATHYDIDTTRSGLIRDTSSIFSSKNFANAKYVPVSRTVNGKVLTGNITINKADIGIDTTNFALSSRTINGQPLTSNVNITVNSILDTTNIVRTNKIAPIPVVYSPFVTATGGAMNCAVSNNWILAVTGTTTFTITNITAGQIVNLVITNENTSTINFSGVDLWPDGETTPPDPPTPGAGNSWGVYTFLKVGATILGSLKKF